MNRIQAMDIQLLSLTGYEGPYRVTVRTDKGWKYERVLSGMLSWHGIVDDFKVNRKEWKEKM